MFQIRPARPDEMDEVRTLFQEYADSLNVDLCFQNFKEELKSLPGTYDPILVASSSRTVFRLSGCVALRPLTTAIAEMKRLYVRPEYRGNGLGRELTGAIIQAARDRDFRSLRLDTLLQLREAISLYRQLGFREIAPYNGNPVPGTLFLELDLD